MDGDPCSKRLKNYCYLCGQVTVAKAQKTISPALAHIYRLYYHMAVVRDVWWAPKFMCASCTRALREWEQKQRPQMPYAIPMIWSNPGAQHQADNCYVCANDIYGINRKNKAHIIYKSVGSAMCPVLHDDNLPPPIHPADLDPNYIMISKRAVKCKDNNE